MKNLCLFLPFLILASCATITRGVHEKFRVGSEPSGAKAELSSGERGVTPITFLKSRKENFDVTVSMPGYISQTVKVRSNLSPTGGGAMAGNLIASGVVGVGVDAVSGASLSLYPNPLFVRLVPAPKSFARSTSAETRTRKATSASKASQAVTKPIIVPAPEEKAPEATNTPAASPTP
jgi:hypothetical protein